MTIKRKKTPQNGYLVSPWQCSPYTRANPATSSHTIKPVSISPDIDQTPGACLEWGSAWRDAEIVINLD